MPSYKQALLAPGSLLSQRTLRNNQHLNPLAYHPWGLSVLTLARWSHIYPFRRARYRGAAFLPCNTYSWWDLQSFDLTRLSLGKIKDTLLCVLSFGWACFVSLENLFLHRRCVILGNSPQAWLQYKWEPRKDPPYSNVSYDVMAYPWQTSGLVLLNHLFSLNWCGEWILTELIFMPELEQRKLKDYVIAEICK